MVHVWLVFDRHITDCLIAPEWIELCANDNLQPPINNKAIRVEVLCVTCAVARNAQVESTPNISYKCVIKRPFVRNLSVIYILAETNDTSHKCNAKNTLG